VFRSGPIMLCTCHTIETTLYIIITEFIFMASITPWYDSSRRGTYKPNMGTKVSTFRVMISGALPLP
jgi:hypothetical protein